MQEEILYQYWHYYALEGKEISLANGHRLRIIREGELNRRQGPDIRFAKFTLDDVIYQGDIEFHLSVSDWYVHGHHLDVAYVNVLLHLIAFGKPLPVHHQQSTSAIMSYVLPAPVHLDFKNHPARTCTEGLESKQQIKDILISMALKRFDNKISAYRSMLEYRRADVLFYENIFDMLGSPYNRLPFRLLAQKLTLTHLRQLSAIPSRTLLPALYFGLAGFLSGNNPDLYTRTLTEEYRRYSYLLPEVSISGNNWDMHLVRPHNHPHFRLAAWVFTISYHYPYSIFDLIKEVFQQRAPYKHVETELKALFSLEVESYWQDHFALNKALKKRRNRKYWGDNRLSEIIINVILPLLTAAAEQAGSYGFVEYLRLFYLTISAKLSYGKITHNMPWYLQYKQQLSQPALLQAMLYLDMNYCRDYRCEDCPLGRLQTDILQAKEKL